MRRRVVVCAALAAIAAPASASAQTCTVPKGWSTSAAQLQYDLYKEYGIAGARIQRHIPPPGSSVDTAAFIRRLPQTATEVGVGTIESALYLAAAPVMFGAAFATATLNDPPQCSAVKKRR